jgi:hypothetical protein
VAAAEALAGAGEAAMPAADLLRKAATEEDAELRAAAIAALAAAHAGTDDDLRLYEQALATCACASTAPARPVSASTPASRVFTARRL